MAPPIKSVCKRGHPFTLANTRFEKLANGYTVRKCKRCRSLFDGIRYSKNPKRQAAVRHAASVRHYLRD